jgi:hypothetical protein
MTSNFLFFKSTAYLPNCNKNVTRNLTAVCNAKGTNFSHNLQDIKTKEQSGEVS